MRRSAVGVGILAVALGGCAPKDIFYKVSIVTTSCDSAQNPFDGVQYLRLRVTGDGIGTPLEATAVKDAAARELKVPAIPAGANRVIEVRGYDGDPAAGGRVVSLGRTSPFDVPDVVPDALAGAAIEKFIFLRRVNAFTPPSSAAQPSQCQRMRVARAGHSATLLKNGKVFVAGGFNFKPGLPEKLSLSETEVFDPATGAFGQAADMAITSGTFKLPKAFHTATRLLSGQVLLWGGETYSGAGNTVAPNAIILIYDADQDQFGALKSRSTPPSIVRSQHSAALDKNGKVLIVGGLSRRTGTLVRADEVEWLDPDNLEYKVVSGVTLPRVGPAVSAVKQGELIAVAGGSKDDATLETRVSFFEYDGTAFREKVLANPPSLTGPGRRAPGVATLRDGNDMVLLGGYTNADPASGPTTSLRPVASSEIVTTSSATVAQGPSVGSRGDICAVTMADGTVLAVGGRTTDTAGGPSHSDATSVLLKADSGGGTNAVGGPTLATGRFAHSCTLLADGTVLVLGGINEATNGTQEVLQDAWIFQPAPVD